MTSKERKSKKPKSPLYNKGSEKDSLYLLVGDTTMKKITMGTILNTLCEELELTPAFDRPFSYSVFKKIMLANDLFTTENAIKIRWEQMIAMDELIKSKGMNHKGELVITLDLTSAYRKIVLEGLKPSFSLSLSLTDTKEGSQ